MHKGYNDEANASPNGDIRNEVQTHAKVLANATRDIMTKQMLRQTGIRNEVQAHTKVLANATKDIITKQMLRQTGGAGLYESFSKCTKDIMTKQMLRQTGI